MALVRTVPLLLISTLLLAACSKKGEPIVEQPAPPPAPAAAAAQSNVAQLTIGELSAMALRDGDVKFPNDAKTLGVGHTPEEVAQVLTAAGLPTTELSLSIQPLLVKAGDKVLLFDTGAGTKRTQPGEALRRGLPVDVPANGELRLSVGGF